MPLKDPEKRKQYDKERYLQNRKKILEKKKLEHKENPEKYKQRCRNYHYNNREKICERKKRKREYKPKRVPKYLNEAHRGRIMREKIRAIVSEYKDRPCALCGIQLHSICMD